MVYIRQQKYTIYLTVENVKIYEIKASANDNYLVLHDLAWQSFFWNDAKFIKNDPGDYIFVVNKTGKEALFTRLVAKDITAVYYPEENSSRFEYLGTEYKVRGQWDRFVRFEILERKNLPEDWAWTTILGSGEVYDLWKTNGDLMGQIDRLEKIGDLRRIFTTDLAKWVFDQCTELLQGQVALLPEIVEALRNPYIPTLLLQPDFVFQLAKDKLEEFIAFQPDIEDNDLYPRLLDWLATKTQPFLSFRDTFSKESNDYKLLQLIGELIAYCDTNAAGKQEFNRYEDRRAVASSGVRQPIWVKNLIQFKLHDNNINSISSPSIQNALQYLLSPAAEMPVLSEDHRRMIATSILQTAYDKLSFISDVLHFFEPYHIHPFNPLNLTRIIADVLYSAAVKPKWFDKIEGLIAADSSGWLDDAIEDITESKRIVLWWSKLPTGGPKTQKLLRQQINEKGFFYIYYAQEGEANYRARVVDFAMKEEYASKNWNADGNPAWYHQDFDDYKEDEGGRKARIVFLTNELVGLQNPVPYKQFQFYKDQQEPRQNNMQAFSEVTDDNEAIIPAQPTIDAAEKVADDEIADEEIVDEDPLQLTDILEWDSEYRSIIMAAKTKPFVLLSGISGIGKSRLVRTLAYKTCALPSLQKDPPRNYLLIQVKPNWNDSTELLGYESGITGRREYKITPFMKFLLQAWQYPDIPFFVCLDEMNLAPVELYFAEYLSAIESRQYDPESGSMLTDPLIHQDVYRKFDSPEFWKDLNIVAEKELQNHLRNQGLGIPQNLIVIGTVNMDETTHSFSRKVLDRAMTIEMNQVDLRQGLKPGKLGWEYPSEFYSKKLICGVHTSAGDVYSLFPETAEEVLALLIEINAALENTPFKIAYRSRDESLIYCYHHSTIKSPGDDTWLQTPLDEIMPMKILSRIEGDEAKCREPLDKLATIFKARGLDRSVAKVKEMIDKLKYGYTQFF